MMKELPDDHTLDELVELAQDASLKAKTMYETATAIAQKWERRYQEKQAMQQESSVTK